MDSLEYDRNNIKFSNNDVRGSHILITGEKLINKNTKEEYKISVLGDVLWEGTISVEGSKKIAKEIIDKNVLKDEFLLSADYNADGTIKMNDNIYDRWVTNSIGLQNTIENAYVEETLNLVVKPEHRATGEPESFVIGDPNEEDRRKAFMDTRQAIHDYYVKYRGRNDVYELQYNVANWAVHYHENITIRNTGNKTRKISFILGSEYTKSINIIPNSIGLESVYHYMHEKDENKEVVGWTITVNPNKEITIPTEVILGGMSSGYIEKRIKVVE